MRTWAFAGLAVSLFVASPAAAGKFLIEGVWMPGDATQIAFTPKWYVVLDGTFTFEGADLLSAEVRSTAVERFDPYPRGLPGIDVPLESGCTAFVGSFCAVPVPGPWNDAARLDAVSASGLEFLTPHKYQLRAANGGLPDFGVPGAYKP